MSMHTPDVDACYAALVGTVAIAIIAIIVNWLDKKGVLTWLLKKLWPIK